LLPIHHPKGVPMTEWQRAWRHVTKPSKRRNKGYLKRANHRANRRMARLLSDAQVKLDKLQVI
jgi:hypothetical protein